MTLVLILFTGIRAEVSVILIYLLMILFEVFDTILGINLYKKKNKTSGFKVYIFECVLLLIELVFSSLIAYVYKVLI